MSQSFLNWKIELIIYFKNIQNLIFLQIFAKMTKCEGGNVCVCSL